MKGNCERNDKALYFNTYNSTFFLVFEQGVNFYFGLSPENYVAYLAWNRYHSA